MAEPKIVFCPNNHIYDAALHSECPYCKKIAEEQKELNKSLRQMDASDDNDNTELLRRNAKQFCEADDDRTEMIFHDEEDDDHTEMIFRDEEDRTEVIRSCSDMEQPNKTVHNHENNPNTAHEQRYVVGWFVCKNGLLKGRSFEITEGINYIYVQDNRLVLSSVVSKEIKQLATVFRSNSTRNFSIRPFCGIKCMVNGAVCNGETFMKTYDTIVLDNYQLVFVELMTEFVEWGS